MKAILLAVGAGVCWGVGEVFTRSVLHTGRIGPVTAIAVRTTVALPVLWLAYLLVVHGGWGGPGGEPRDWMRAGWPTLAKLILGSGLVAGAAAMIFFYMALNLGEVSRVKPIAFALAPAVGAVLAFAFLGEPVTARKIAGICAVLVGIVLLAGGGRPAVGG
jgi:uncharacterized membrane protein